MTEDPPVSGPVEGRLRMSAYLQFFQLQRSPFDTSAQGHLVLGTQALRDAFAAIERGLADGSPRICVNGKAGLGKTSLARSLPKLLAESARVVVLLNPSLPWRILRTAIIKQLGLDGGLLSRTSLAAAADAGRRLVVVIDRAETISRESLEHLDILLQYRTDDDRQLVHCVLLANLEVGAGGDPECALLWWLDRLTTLQLEFAPIPPDGVASYIHKHLKRAGWKGGRLFSGEASLAVHRLTGGVPRAVSEMCDRVLAAAAERGRETIDAALVEEIGSGARPHPESSLGHPPEVAPDPPAQPPAAAPRLERSLAAPSFVTPAASERLKPWPRLGSPLLAPVEAPLSVDFLLGGGDSDFEDDELGPEPPAPMPIVAIGGGGRWKLWAAGLVCIIGVAAAGVALLPSAEPPVPSQAKTPPKPPATAPARVLARKKPPEPAAETVRNAGDEPGGDGLASAPSPAAPAPRSPESTLQARSERGLQAFQLDADAPPPASPAMAPSETATDERHW